MQLQSTSGSFYSSLIPLVSVVLLLVKLVVSLGNWGLAFLAWFLGRLFPCAGAGKQARYCSRRLHERALHFARWCPCVPQQGEGTHLKVKKKVSGDSQFNYVLSILEVWIVELCKTSRRLWKSLRKKWAFHWSKYSARYQQLRWPLQALVKSIVPHFRAQVQMLQSRLILNPKLIVRAAVVGNWISSKFMVPYIFYMN